VSEPEPEVSESVDTVASADDTKSAVEPVFRESSYRPAPINTTAERTSKETGVIIEGMSITGDVISDGNLDIMGSVKGNINLEGKLKVTGSIEGNSDVEEVFADGAKITGDLKALGTVKIGAGTVVRGNVTASGGVFAGAVKGDIDIMGPVVLDSTAIIMGNIKSKTIQINNGAIIEGLCSQCYAEVSPTEFFERE
nr:polymer-forming cytoskeletal protein [Lachnospiraceae bacterium]